MENNVSSKNSINNDLSSLPENQTAPIVTITLDVNDINLIVGGLQELPHRVVDSLIKKIVQQAQNQLDRPA